MLLVQSGQDADAGRVGDDRPADSPPRFRGNTSGELSKTPWPKANNRSVLRPYSKDMERLNKKGIRRTVRPSGHNIKSSFSGVDPGGSIPPNVVEEALPADLLKVGNNAANGLLHHAVQVRRSPGIHIRLCFPRRPPRILPEAPHRGRLDIVLDPFAGSNTTGAVAESLGLRWIAIELVESYLEASRFRFFS